MTRPVLERVRCIAADLLNIPLEQILPASSPDSIENWDSLNHLNLVLGLEGEFGVQFSPEEIAKAQSVESIVLLVQNKLAGAE
ncbi:MAG: acyl carrier protein [Candidatus Binatia bacterium]